jgi:hypothetical protein
LGKYQHIKTSATGSLGHYEWKQHKPWFDKECSKLLNQRKQVKLQSLQSPHQTGGANLNNLRCESKTTLRNNRKEEMSLKQPLGTKITVTFKYSGINEFKSYKPRTSDENGDLLADSHNILNRWKNYFCHILNVHGINDVRQRDMHIAEPLVPEPSSFENEIAIEKLKTHNSSSTDKIPADLIQAGGNTLCSEIHRLTNSIWNEEELLQQ